MLLDLKIELISQGLESFSIVLKSGEVMTPWGWYSTEGEGLHFSFTRKKLELIEEEKVLIETGEGLKNEHSAIEEELKLLREQATNANSVRAELSNAQREVSSLLKVSK